MIETLTERTKEVLIEKVDKMPEEWDGYEIRRLFADYVKEEIAYIKMPEERKKEYINTRLIKNI